MSLLLVFLIFLGRNLSFYLSYLQPYLSFHSQFVDDGFIYVCYTAFLMNELVVIYGVTALFHK